MITDPVLHTTLVIERDLPLGPDLAFGYWAQADLKDSWNGCHPDWTVLEDRLDVRTGGSEVKHWRTPDGLDLTLDATYLDVEPGQRLIYAYEMSFGGQRLSASLVTLELVPQGGGTRMRLTEQMAFLGDAAGLEQRIQGTEAGYDRLMAILEGRGQVGV